MGSILDAMETALKAAIGTGSGATHEIATANFAQKKFPWKLNTALPGLFLSPVPELEKNATNVSDDIGHGVQVTIAQVGNQDLESNMDRLFFWREKAMRVFRNRVPDGMPADVYKCEIEPRPIVDPAAFVGQVDATAFVVRCWARTTRP
jgi:hypothetical protein